MKKRIVSALLVLAMVLMLIPTTVSAASNFAPALSVSAERTDNTVVATVKAAPYSGCLAAQVNLSFPSDKLTVEASDIECTGVLQGATRNVASGNAIATVWAGDTTPRASETEETILRVTFSINEGVTGTIPFEITKYAFGDGDESEIRALPSGSTGTASVVIPITDASTISATVAEPEKGKALATKEQAVVPENAPYTVTEVYWFEGRGTDGTPATGNAKPSQQYSVRLTVSANEGECFDYAAVHTKQSADGYAIIALGNPAESTCNSLWLTKTFTEPTAGANPLLGKVTIDATDGKARYDETLTLTLELDYNGETADELNYQWKRDNELIQNATDATYTVGEADIGHDISVEVTSITNSGSVTSENSVRVIKALNNSTPTAPTEGSATATSDTISVNYTGEEGKTYQFAARLASDTSSELVWQDSSTLTGLLPNKDYNIYVREAETDTHEPSEASSALTVKTQKGTVQPGSQLAKDLVSSVTVYRGEYDGTAHNAFTVKTDKQELLTGWTVQYQALSSENWSDYVSVTNVNDSNAYNAKFSHADYNDYIADSVYTVSITKAENYLTVSQEGGVYETTTVGQIIQNNLNKTKATGKPDTLTLPTGTVTLYKDSACTEAYTETDKFTAKTDAYTVYYKFTPTGSDANNYKEVTGSFELTVQKRGVERIALTEPTNKTFTYGDVITPASLNIMVTYTDGKTESLPSSEYDNVTITPLTVGTTTVTVEYQGKTYEITGITVNPVLINTSNAKIKLAKPNEKIEYNGNAHKPEFYVECELSNNPHFIIPADQYTEAVYENNTDAGTAKIKVTGKENANYKIDGTAEGTFTIWKKPVTMENIVLKTKIFNGDKNAEIESCTLVGVLEQDKNDAKLDTVGTATYAKEVPGTHDVTFANYALTGSRKDNYTLSQPTGIKGEISKKEIEISALTVKSKEYDGTKTAEINTITFSGEVTSQSDSTKTYTARLDTSASTIEFNSADAGTHDIMLDLKLDSNSSEWYTLKKYETTVQGTITAKNVDNSIYAFGTVTVIKGVGEFTNPTFTTKINGSDVAITTGDLTYKVGETTYTHDELVNYLKTQAKDTTVPATGSATVSATANGNFTGTVSGTIKFVVKDIEFKVGSDSATMTNTYPWDNTYGSLIYAGKDSTWETYLKKIADPVAEVNGQKIDGTYEIKVYDANGNEVEKGFTPGNYVFKLIFNDTNGQYPNTEVWATSPAAIGKAQIVVADGSASGITVKDRAYNGSNDVTASDLDMSGLVLTYVNGPLKDQRVTDSVTLAYSSAKYDSKNAGDRTVTLRTLSLNGADKDNFTLANASGSSSYKSIIELPAEITKIEIDVSNITGITISDKVYDGTLNLSEDQVNLNGAVMSEVLPADKATVKLVFIDGKFSGSYISANVGTWNVVLGNVTLTGNGSQNYELSLNAVTARGEIKARQITVESVEIADKTYDGNAYATVKNIVYGNVVDGETINANVVARFGADVQNESTHDPNAGVGKQVSYGIVSLNDNNYVLTGTLPTATATIHEANLTGQPTFTKITQSGKTLGGLQDSDVDLTGIHGVANEQNSLDLVLFWGEDGSTVIQPNRSYSWEVKATNTRVSGNYEILTGSVVLYPVSTGYSDQVKKQIEEFEAKKRGELPEDDTTFRDVDEDDYFFDAVNWAAENGITGGVGANRFGPSRDCSRGETMTFLWRAMGEPEPDSTRSDLTDVMTGSYYYDAVLWAMEEGITTGMGANRFAPGATVTRGQFVTFLYRLASASSDGVHPFTDVPAGSYYEKAIAWAYAEGITNGTSATTFSPDAPCTRAQIITFLYRYFNR